MNDLKNYYSVSFFNYHWSDHELSILAKSHIHPMVRLFQDVTNEIGYVIGPFCSIGLHPEIRGFNNPNQFVHIYPGTTITGHVTIDGGSVRPTYIGHNVMLMKHVHIGHDAIIHDDCTLSPGCRIGGHAVIGKGCTIGMNAVIHQRVEIPEGCMIGMGAIIPKGKVLKPYTKYVGVAKDIGPNIKALEKLNQSS